MTAAATFGVFEQMIRHVLAESLPAGQRFDRVVPRHALLGPAGSVESAAPRGLLRAVASTSIGFQEKLECRPTGASAGPR